jgi:hypothetical protein
MILTKIKAEFSPDILWHPTKIDGPKVFLLTKIKPEFSDILWHPTKIYGSKVFLLTKIKPEYSNILYNRTYFPGLYMQPINTK